MYCFTSCDNNRNFFLSSSLLCIATTQYKSETRAIRAVLLVQKSVVREKCKYCMYQPKKIQNGKRKNFKSFIHSVLPKLPTTVTTLHLQYAKTFSLHWCVCCFCPPIHGSFTHSFFCFCACFFLFVFSSELRFLPPHIEELYCWNGGVQMRCSCCFRNDSKLRFVLTKTCDNHPDIY